MDKEEIQTQSEETTKVDETKEMSYTVTPGENNELTTTIKVIAEGSQIDSFDDAYEALNTTFGVPGSYNPWEE